MEALYTKGRKVLSNALNQPSAQPTTAVILIYEHVADPGESETRFVARSPWERGERRDVRAVLFEVRHDFG